MDKDESLTPEQLVRWNAYAKTQKKLFDRAPGFSATQASAPKYTVSVCFGQLEGHRDYQYAKVSLVTDSFDEAMNRVAELNKTYEQHQYSGWWVIVSEADAEGYRLD